MRENAFIKSLYPSNIIVGFGALCLIFSLASACYNNAEIVVRECADGHVDTVLCDDSDQVIYRVCEGGRWTPDRIDCEDPTLTSSPCEDGDLRHEVCEGWAGRRTLECHAGEWNDLGCAEISLSAASTQANEARTGFCVLESAGRAYCWGDNSEGQAGRGHADEITNLAPASGEHAFLSIARGIEHSCAIGADRRLYCWGSNAHKKSGRDDESGRLAPRMVTDLQDVQRVAVGPDNTCAIDRHAHLYCWGSNAYKQLARENVDATDVPVRIAELEAVEQMSIGYGLICAIADNSQLYCWGNNDLRLQSDAPDNLVATPTPITYPALTQDVAVGRTHVCALSEGDVFCWGKGDRGQLGHGTLEDSHEAVRVPLDVPARAIAVGDALSCAVTENDALYCWGQNTAKEIDVSTDAETVVLTPGHVEGIDDVRSVAIASFTDVSTQHTVCAATQRGEVACWGAQRGWSIPHPDVNAPPSAPIFVTP